MWSVSSWAANFCQQLLRFSTSEAHGAVDHQGSISHAQAVRESDPESLLPTGVPLGETIGHTARFARIANVVAVPVANPWHA